MICRIDVCFRAWTVFCRMGSCFIGWTVLCRLDSVLSDGQLFYGMDNCFVAETSVSDSGFHEESVKPGRYDLWVISRLFLRLKCLHLQVQAVPVVEALSMK